MNIKFVFFVAVFFVAIAIKAQQSNFLEISKAEFQAKQVIPPAPEAAELGKYGNVPVSLFTGTPNINIPLFELKGNNISLPISLSYNASGFKPEDIAPWVGSNWSLNAGGVITRAVLGNPDNGNNYFGLNTALNPPSSSNSIAYKKYVKNVEDGTIETQPDVYYYNFAGHSGKFMIKPDGSIFKKEKNLISISNCMNCTNSSFTIKDEQGITYVFNEAEITKSMPSDDAGQPSYVWYTYPSAWYLSAMYSASGEQIEFEYYTTSEQTLYQNMVDNRSMRYTWGAIPGNGSCGYSKVDNTETSYFQPPTVSIKRKFLKRIVLKKINQIVASIDLLSLAGQRQDSNFPEDRMLSKITLYALSNDILSQIKSFVFSFGYFSGESNEKKLRLDRLQEFGNDNISSKPPYIFSYNNSPIPPRFTTALDHWGFFNQATNNHTLIPNIFIPFRVITGGVFPERYFGGNANREPTLAGSSTTLLNKIQYPTGGYTIFEFELNKARFEDNSTHDVGGVRISKITDYHADNQQATAKSYQYLLDDNVTTSGIGGNYRSYQTNSTYQRYFTPYIGSSCELAWQHNPYIANVISLSAHSMFGLGSFQGNHFGYSQVTETQIDVTALRTNGKIVYNYTTLFRSENDDDLSNGDLIRQGIYNANGKLIEETSNVYQNTNLEYLYGYKVKPSDKQTNKAFYCKTSDNIIHNYGDWENSPGPCVESGYFPSSLYMLDYGIQEQNKQLVQQIVKKYDQLNNNYITSTKNLTYGNPVHNFPTQTDETTNNNQLVSTTNKYAIDYNIPKNSTGIAAHIKELQQRNMPGILIEKLQFRQNADGTNKRYIGGQITDYNSAGSPLSIYVLEPGVPLNSVPSSEISNAGVFSYDADHFRLSGSFNYNSQNNLSEQFKTGDMIKSYIWDYNGQYPVAEVSNANEGRIAYTSFETSAKGNFDFEPSAALSDASSPTGKRCYNLSDRSITAYLDPATNYILSYWSKNAGPCQVSGSNNVARGFSFNGWTYYEHKLTGASTSSITGNGLIDELRLYPAQAMMTTVAYEPGVGAISQCDAGSHLVHYEYDAFHRLVNVKDANGYIIKNYKYNYGNGYSVTPAPSTLFYNTYAQQNFTKTGCISGSTPEVLTYVVPSGKYVSAVDQPTADGKAITDIAANGQNYVNTYGRCLYFNIVKSKRFFRNNCLPEEGLGGPYVYRILAGSYSAISQDAADALAQADLDANGQAQANLNGTCLCGAENQRIVNGVCETGGRVNDDNKLENGRWKCTYHYVFTGGIIKGPFYSYSTSPNACQLINPN